MKYNRIHLLNTYIDVLSLNQTVHEVNTYISNKCPLHLMGVNADKINMLNITPQLREIVNNCDIINADGASIILAAKYLGTPLPERVAGIDLMMELVKLAAEKKYKIFLLGSKEDIVNETAQVLQSRFPTLEIVGIRNGYFKKEEWDIIGDEIKNSNAQIVFVGITSPLKEYLIDYFLTQKNINTVFMGVGGSFDVISGRIPRAPVWMQKRHLEWLFRFYHEPIRLFNRYFIGNCKFIVAVYKEKKMRKKNEGSDDWR